MFIHRVVKHTVIASSKHSRTQHWDWTQPPTDGGQQGQLLGRVSGAPRLTELTIWREHGQNFQVPGNSDQKIPKENQKNLTKPNFKIKDGC